MRPAAGKGVLPVAFLALPLAIWGAHFLLSYIVAAVYCAKSDDAASAIVTIRWIVLGCTMLALAAIGFALQLGYKRPSASDHQARFFWTVLQSMSALSAFAILCVAGSAFFFGNCQ